MARKGRKPVPTRLKVLRGNPGRRPLPKNEPKPEQGIPQPPVWLSPVARQEWERVVPRLAEIGLLTMVDGFILEAYCTCYAHWVECEGTIAKTGFIYKPSSRRRSKYLQQVPHVTLAQKFLIQAGAFATELGLSPSARARPFPPREGDTDYPLEDLLRE